jgi:hypothetical protein
MDRRAIPDADHPTVKIYTGFLTHLFKDLSISVPNYTLVRQELMRMGCVEQLHRGGGDRPSKWALIKPPTVELFKNSGKILPLTGRTTQATMTTQRLEDLHDRVTAIETYLWPEVSENQLEEMRTNET